MLAFAVLSSGCDADADADEPETKAAQPANKKQRRDAHLSNVIISERLDKKLRQFQAAAVPRGFETAEAYERALRLPLGKEFNVAASFKELVARRVHTKAGIIIEPLKKSKAMREQAKRKGLYAPKRSHADDE
eukprot:Amastigsp_a677609_14.p6 type:complete len:133 gc:universal Amastigsp_a677609_14:425-27(-)